MPSLTRLTVAGLSGLALVAGALSATAPSYGVETPAPTATPAPAQTATTAPAPTTATAAPSPTDGLAADPSLAEQNRARNHSMGSTIAANEPGAAQPRGLSSMAAGQPPGVQGLDVSGWQVLNASDWARVWANGGRFVYVKATEATDYVSSQFAAQYSQSYNAGLLHGAYHFATPNTSSGAAQATWFLNHGGQGTADGRTMPPLLDIEYNPYGATCYGLSAAQMVSWIRDFSNTIQAKTGRLPAIYSTTNWWTQCTGNSSAFSANPLFIARYPSNIADGAGTLPAGWSRYTLWQYADAGIFPGDQDVFNGTLSDLLTYGAGTTLVRTASNPNVYLVSGSAKYAVKDTATLNALAPLGPVGYVSQAYLDAFQTLQAVGRVIRAPDGTMSFIDNGRKLQFATCDLVAAYGGSCDPSGYVQLSSDQAAKFTTGPALTSLAAPSGGPRYYVQSGKRREVLDTASLTQAGIGSTATALSAGAISYLPLGAPIVRDGVYATRTGTTTGVLLSGGKAWPVDQNTATTTGLSTRAAGTLQSASIAQLAAGTPFIGAVQQTGTSTVQVVASDGLHPWTPGLGGAAFTPVPMSATALGMWQAKPAIALGSAVQSSTDSTVYVVRQDVVRPVSTWDALLQVSGGTAPAIATLPQALVDGLPKGLMELGSGAPVLRYAGTDRFATSASVSAKTFAPGVDVAYVANGLDFPDALSGAAAAGDTSGPVLLSQSGALSSSVATELTRLQPKRIVVLGGTGVISAALQTALARYTTGTVTRYAGDDRYSTSATISAKTFAPGVRVAYVASGTDFPDALSGAPAAGMLGGPVLLTQHGALSDAVAAELTRLKPQKIVVLGGTGAIPAALQTTLASYTTGSVARYAGADRYGTSAAISANTFAPGVPVAYVSNGLDFPDALSGAPAAGGQGGPVLLTRTDALSASVAAELTRLKPKKIVVLGGTGVLSTSLQTALQQYLGK